MRPYSKSQVAAVLMASFCSTDAFAFVNYLSDEELIARADFIALVEVESFVKENPGRRVGKARAHARVIELERGPENLREIDFQIDAWFPCASVHMEPGLHFVFLQRRGDEWHNSNYSRSFRKVVGDQVLSEGYQQRTLDELIGMIPDAKRKRFEDPEPRLRPLPSFEIRGPW